MNYREIKSRNNITKKFGHRVEVKTKIPKNTRTLVIRVKMSISKFGEPADMELRKVRQCFAN